MTKIEEITAAIETRAAERFEVCQDAHVMPNSSLDEGAHRILRLRRRRREAGARTILVAEVANERESLRMAFMCAADLRDSLSDPEASDLYMIMAIDGVSDQDASRIETDDRFCRKYVLRGGESVHSLLDRSFLVSGQEESQLTALNDPFRVALAAVAEAHPWMRGHMDGWRGALLSGDGTSELVNRLLVSAKEGVSNGNS
ncbi:ABC-three component system middle component 1 [Stenotrophomonas sp. Ker107b]